MRNVAIFPYNAGSEGVRALADSLEVRIIKRENSRYVARPDKVVINWGASNLPDRVRGVGRVLNDPLFVANMSNKRRFFELMNGGPRLPDHWIRNGHGDMIGSNPDYHSPYVLLERVRDAQIVCRTVLNGHSGEGIHIYGNDQFDRGVDMPRCQLYTRYVKKAAEFRIHFMGGVVFDAQRKIKDPDREVRDWKVRSHDNGFIFVRENVNIPEDVLVQATACFERSGLDFGAVDVIWNEREGQAYVLEINTAPGLTGTTLENYSRAFRNILQQR